MCVDSCCHSCRENVSWLPLTSSRFVIGAPKSIAFDVVYIFTKLFSATLSCSTLGFPSAGFFDMGGVGLFWVLARSTHSRVGIYVGQCVAVRTARVVVVTFPVWLILSTVWRFNLMAMALRWCPFESPVETVREVFMSLFTVAKI